MTLLWLFDAILFAIGVFAILLALAGLGNWLENMLERERTKRGD